MTFRLTYCMAFLLAQQESGSDIPLNANGQEDSWNNNQLPNNPSRVPGEIRARPGSLFLVAARTACHGSLTSPLLNDFRLIERFSFGQQVDTGGRLPPLSNDCLFDGLIAPDNEKTRGVDAPSFQCLISSPGRARVEKLPERRIAANQAGRRAGRCGGYGPRHVARILANRCLETWGDLSAIDA
jgi:hypothetical protein